MARRRAVQFDAPEEALDATGSEPEAPATRRAGNARIAPGPDPGARPPAAFSRIWAALKILSGVGLVVGTAAGVAFGAHHYALHSPRFVIESIDVDGNRRLRDAEVARLAQVSKGANIFALDLAEAERRLLSDPWVREVKVRRELPSAVQVELVEREADALAVIGEGVYLVTRAGEPFKRLEPGDPHDLPVIGGVSADNIAGDRPREIERIVSALEILRHWGRLDVSRRYPAQEIFLTPGGGAVLTVGKRGTALHLGEGSFRKKLLMAERVIGRLERQGQTPGVVFLDNRAHPERVVVRMRP